MTDNTLTGHERVMGDDDIIVSKTDLKGHITYANDVFCHIADYTVEEIMGEPHSVVRHPDMPRCVFKLLWDYISQGKEIFAYVVNRAKNGDHYWVFAHVTPSFDEQGNIIGYHSNRRKPSEEAVKAITGVYQLLIKEEQKHKNRKQGMQAGFDLLVSILNEKGISYDELVLSL
jgi:PAS domain S-box-containing protein